ncbi:beta-ketoacyl synthase N-terminal-like domain-containing protein, partial [Methylocucumis oryzae]|uniref:beta-ketoacyl synthase N-terminal-like domain-containing protein n=1 Tax=Methylocucumis oryzae TaxID=1632867 RepID=UPI000AFDD1FB
MHLPGYVFAKQAIKLKSVQQPRTDYPLLHNDSTLNGQSYRIALTGQELFLTEHRIQGVAVLPAVVYLQWLCEALADASRDVGLAPNQTWCLRNVLWAKPLHVDSSASLVLRILITPITDKQLAFKIINTDEHTSEYCVGEAELSELTGLAPLALTHLQPEHVVNGDECYQRFTALGFDYGASFRGLTQLSICTDGVLAKLTQNISSYGLLDSALQALIGFSYSQAKSGVNLSPGLPFALSQFDCVDTSLTLSQAWLTQQSSPTGTLTQYHIVLCDEQGRIGLRFQGLSVRQMVAANITATPLKLSETSSEINELSLDAVQLFLRQAIARVLELQPERIRADADWSMLGVDSIIMLQLTRELEKSFGTLAKTLFFEYQNLTQLSAYFVEAHALRLQALLSKDGTQSVPYALPQVLYPIARRVRMAYPNTPNHAALDIAIVGLSGRYAKADDIKQFWCNLRDGVDAISEIPQQRWDWHAFYRDENQPHGSHSSRWGGFINDYDCFEPLFFNIAPREAQFMDPQERLFLQQAWQALEDAGYTPKDLERDGEAGVYAGVMYSEYQLFSRSEAADDTRIGFVGNFAGVANRVSYHLNCHGPSMTVDTMCSSSLSAIHLACQDLQHARISVALAGGVNLSLHPNKYSMLSGGGFISPRGRCHSFGAEGDGYIPGEGVGVVVLKRLSDALRDGDSIYGVIKSSVINHGGKTQAYSVPNPNAQQRVISQALAQAGLSADAISYVETHGTGTPLGDPIEITGLCKAFGDIKQRCPIGSVKSNIGHC